MDDGTKSMIKKMFATCDVALRCAKCKNVYVSEPVVSAVDMDEAKLQGVAMSALTKVSAHKCGGFLP